EGENSDSYKVFPDYSQLVPDRTLVPGTWLKGANRWLPMFRFVTFRFVFRYVLFGDESDKMAV
ncbi:hypothetical protein, partial [Mycolicibacterium sp. GF69]|uniref:hypothetical protein n=1 Tax=Mycolicibacterium sp. GF69 TaxID=2267251 RepID=UPI00197B2891